MPQYKLTYFNARALGEHIRLIFLVKGIDFEDVRIEFDQWGELKAKTGYGQMPILEVDGKQLTQSLTIGRFLGKRYNLVPEDDWLNARADEIVDTATEARLEFRLWVRSSDETKKAEALKNLQENVFPKYLPILEDLVKETSGNFIAGEKLSWHDLFMATWLEIWEDLVLGKDGLNNYPALRALKNGVYETPKIKDYIENKRPKTWI